MSRSKPKKRHSGVWEHLEHTLLNTTYAMRLKWLEQADQFARAAKKAHKKS